MPYEMSGPKLKIISCHTEVRQRSSFDRSRPFQVPEIREPRVLSIALRLAGGPKVDCRSVKSVAFNSS